MTTTLPFYKQCEEILNHRSSTKVKMKQTFALLEQVLAYAKEHDLHSFSNEAFENGTEFVKTLNEIYADFHYSYPNLAILDDHVNLLANIKQQFKEEESCCFFPFTAALQGYAMNHDQERVHALKTFLLSSEPQQPLAIYHAIFSGLKIKPNQDLLVKYYQEVLAYEPSSSQEIKHLESIHEIYEALIWKKR